ncbi:MAG: hypothetical protein Q8908_11660 [Bacteroidota bacterium]|nr:hypothetical protein [Bacteroidota bacterium]
MDKKVLMNEILTLLDKVNRQAQILEHLPNMARIDVDLLLAEIRQVYDKTLDLQSKIENTRQESKNENKSSNSYHPVSEATPPPPVHKEVKTEEPVLFSEPIIEKPAPPVDFEYIPPPKVEAPKPVIAEPAVKPPDPASQKSIHEVYEEKTEDHSLLSRLQYNPINDLRSAIGISDKFLIMNQLFKGSLEQYNGAIERLNNFYNYDDAEVFLGSLKILHDWADDLPAIEKLSHFVKRRYQKE